MRSFLVTLTMLVLIASCSEEKTVDRPKYRDPWRQNFNGEPSTIELLAFRVDSTGKLIPDSVAREFGEWKNDYLQTYSEFDSAGKLVATATYTYHPNGKPHLLTIEKNGKIFERYESLLDSNGRDLSTVLYDSSGKISSYYSGITEDPEGFMLTASVFNADSSLQTRITAAYERRTLMRTTFADSSGKMIRRQAAKLDESGNKIADTLISFSPGSGETIIKKYSYEGYDSLKNWLQQTEADASGKPLKIVKRRIVYAK